MRPRLAVLAVCLLAVAAAAFAARGRLRPGRQADGTTLLADGWRISPAGRALDVGTLPLALAVHPDGRVLALTSGYSENRFVVIDPARWVVTDSVPLSAAWLGLAVRRSGDAFVSGGTTNRVWRLAESGGRWARADSVVLADSGVALFAAGLALAPDGTQLAVVGNLSDSVYLLDAAPLKRAAAASTGSHPYTALFAPDGRTAYVSNWGDSTVSVYGVAGGTLTPRAAIAVPPRPSALAISRDGRTLYVAHAAADEVSVVDLREGRVEATIALGLTARAPHGSGPDALALAPGGRRLYVANGDNNAVAVVDLTEDGARVVGLIPTAWYPTAVAVAANGRTLYVANGKGTGAGPNPQGPTAPGSRPGQYIAALLVGSVSRVPVPDAATLGRYTRQVLANSPYRDALLARSPWPARSPIPGAAGDSTPIRHVVYVIRENRTYDQVLGDDPRGDGDPRLAIFGDSVTPNAHALARRFVLFDNFYVNGDVSADGHMWSDAAYAGDYVEKTWPANYSGRRDWDFLAGLPVLDPLAGYLWDDARRAGVTVRNYGEMTQWDSAAGRARADDKGLERMTDPRYVGWDLAVPDSVRVDEFLRELAAAEAGDTLPQLMILDLPQDHTYGRQPGRPTPRSMVAENDRALGRLVEALSRSRFWSRTAVFVLEDDAQNGPDHVDAHRSPLLVASPWTRRGMVDSTFYTTASVLRTIELILGLSPMSQYDAAAGPLYPAFTTEADSSAWTALPSRWPLGEVNPPRAHSSLDPRVFRRPDMADENVLNREIWGSVRQSPMPAPRHSVMMVRSER
ncbi:MAG TPA: beta-propeller fold lactonase family protein [Gemmatimonadales bacterium]|nr:beta-propeller fold lactonase family protein [Gemmatimonadales bacterium]